MMSNIVGVWRMVTEGAPYPDHIMMFNSDGTFLIHNPTNVEENEDKSGINDSVGMGVWHNFRGEISGTFLQLNAHANNHMPAPDLTVSFKITLPDYDTFTGRALAKFGNGNEQPATLKGKRVVLDRAVLMRITL